MALTNADALNLQNLADNLRSIEKCGIDEEVKKIREFSISAVNDFDDTAEKILGIINKNKDIFYIIPYYAGDVSVNDGGVEKKVHEIVVHRQTEYNIVGFVQNLSCSCCKELKITWKVGGTLTVKGFQSYGISADGVDNAVATSIEVDDCIYSGEYHSFHNDLISSTFHVHSEMKNYTEENLKKYNWSIDGWTDIMEMAKKTRLRTESLVSWFKENLQNRIDEKTKKLNKLSSMAESAVYKKVQL